MVAGADLGKILTDFLNEGPREQASKEARGRAKVPFPRFRSNARKTFVPVDHFPDFNLESSTIIIKNMFLMKNLTDFRKTVETGLDPRQGSSVTADDKTRTT